MISTSDVYEFLHRRYPAMWGIHSGHLTCPQCGLWSTTPLPMITHLNDEHRWTRERIADHLEEMGL